MLSVFFIFMLSIVMLNGVMVNDAMLKDINAKCHLWSGIALLKKSFQKDKRSSLSVNSCRDNRIKKFYKNCCKNFMATNLHFQFKFIAT
jgi:hypothetical protein